MGTPVDKSRINTERKDSPVARDARAPLPPRLLDIRGTATYLSISPWTVRSLEASGILPRVRLPLPNHGELRKILFDRNDLDGLVESWKESMITT